MLGKDSKFSEIKQTLIDKGGYCEDIEVYFDGEDLTGQEIIDKFRNDQGYDSLVRGRVINAIKLLSSEFDSYLNGEFIEILMDRKVSKSALILIWRQIKNLPNFSLKTKESVVSYIKRELPKAEKEDEWIYTTSDGYKATS